MMAKDSRKQQSLKQGAIKSKQGSSHCQVAPKQAQAGGIKKQSF